MVAGFTYKSKASPAGDRLDVQVCQCSGYDCLHLPPEEAHSLRRLRPLLTDDVCQCCLQLQAGPATLACPICADSLVVPTPMRNLSTAGGQSIRC